MQDTAEEAGTWRRAQRQAAETGGQQGSKNSRCTTYHAGRRGGEQVLQRKRGDTKTNATEWGGVRRDEGNKTIQKSTNTCGVGGARTSCKTIIGV